MTPVPEISDEAIAFLRRRLPAMLPQPRVEAKMIAENIAFGAAVLGAGHVELVARRGWWFVASNFNWLRAPCAVAEGAGRPELAVFERIQPFPEQSPTAHRAEIYVTAFAADAYCRVGDAVVWIRGRPSPGPLPDAGVTPPWCRHVLGFRLPAEAAAPGGGATRSQ